MARKQPLDTGAPSMKAGRVNAAWHARHPMPPRPTLEQRIAWHLAHAKHCACRPIPPKLRARVARATRR